MDVGISDRDQLARRETPVDLEVSVDAAASVRRDVAREQVDQRLRRAGVEVVLKAPMPTAADENDVFRVLRVEIPPDLEPLRTNYLVVVSQFKQRKTIW